MSVLTSIGILVFAMLILAFLQLVPGIFLLFTHYASGKYSKLKATDLTTFFILGVETAVVLIFLSLCTILCVSPATTFIIDSDIFAWIMAGIFLALSLVIFSFYYRKGRGSKLFISRRLAHEYQAKIPTVKTRSDAFVFGLTALIPELIFTLPLFLIVTTEIMQLGTDCFARAGLIILFALVTILPLLIFYTFSQHSRNLADFIRFRFKNKTFFRLTLALLYFLIAVLIILGVWL